MCLSAHDWKRILDDARLAFPEPPKVVEPYRPWPPLPKDLTPWIENYVPRYCALAAADTTRGTPPPHEEEVAVVAPAGLYGPQHHGFPGSTVLREVLTSAKFPERFT